MAYTLDELVRSTSVSRRTIYYYIGRGLLPQVGRGRGARYGDEHRLRLLLIRALTDLGVPLDLIQRRLSELPLERLKLLVAPLIPLEDLYRQVREEVQSIRESLEPSTDLDISNLGLEDPMALRHRLSALEDQLARVEREEAKARESVYSNLVSGESGEAGEHRGSSASGGTDHGQLQSLEPVVARLHGICDRLAQLVAERDNRDIPEPQGHSGRRSPINIVVIALNGYNRYRERATADPALAKLADGIAETVARWEAEQDQAGVS